MKFTADEVLQKIPERGDAVAFLKYLGHRKRDTLYFGRIQNAEDETFTISEQIVHKSRIFCVITNDAYNRILAQEIRETRKKLQNLNTNET